MIDMTKQTPAAVFLNNRGMAFWYHKFLHYSFLVVINNTNEILY